MDKMKVFVKIDDYKNILSVMNNVKDKIEEAKHTMAEINKLKNEEDAELELWHSSIDEAERRIEFIDRTLFEPETL
jgi:tetrahydromethanopterin S-methyltransferase subunit G